LSLKNLLASIFFTAIIILCPTSRAEEFNIYFKTSPPVHYLRPFYDPGSLSLLVTSADGKPVAQGWAEIRIEAPKPGRFFSTDFPLVEGTRLLEMRLPLRRGRAEWKYLFPIRGEYRLQVDVVTAEGKKASKVFPLDIREHRSKWYFLGLFTLALFALGVVVGRIFTQASPMRKTKVAGCLLLSMSWSVLPATLAAQEPAAGQYFGWLEIDPATVGKPVGVHWRLEGERRVERPAVLLTLTIAHLEKAKTVFSIERLPSAGEFSMSFQFSDGAEYRVTAIAELQGRQATRTERYVSVSGVEPPAKAMIRAIGFFLAVIVAGLGVGRWSRRAAPNTDNLSREV
jgi:hypothetical protein